DDRLEGGAGNDTLYGDAGDDELLGGEGSDSFLDAEGSNTQTGGGGDDHFYNVSSGMGLDTLTGDGDGATEAGRDTYYLNYSLGGTADRVTDFDAGADGDLIDLFL